MKQPSIDLALTSMTLAMESTLQSENLLLLGLSPDVALANMMKFPVSPPGEQATVSGSCYEMGKKVEQFNSFGSF